MLLGYGLLFLWGILGIFLIGVNNLNIKVYMKNIVNDIKTPKSYHATDKIYGLVTVLPLLVALEHGHKDSKYAIMFILITLLTIWLAESYAEFYKRVYNNKKHLERAEITTIVRKEFVVMLSANAILIPFVLELFGWIELTVAYNLAAVIGIFLLFRIGFRLSLYIDKKISSAILYGAVSASFGFVIVLLKYLIH